MTDTPKNVNDSLEAQKSETTEISLEDAALDWVPQAKIENNKTPSESNPFTLLENPTEVYLPDLTSDEDLELELSERELSERVSESDETLDRLQEKLETNDDAEIKAELLAREQAEAQATEDLLKSQLEEDAALTREEIESQSDGGSEGPIEVLNKKYIEIPETERLGALEALLFVSDKALKPAQILKILSLGEVTKEDEESQIEVVKHDIEFLKTTMDQRNSGFEVFEIQGAYEFRTRAHFATYLSRLKKTQYQRLSSGAMETLAVVAYHGPCLKENIDHIRGVDSSHFMKGLLERNLIEVVGRSEDVGRPMLYNVTQSFYELFGITSKEALPSLTEIEAMIPASESGALMETRFEQKLRENLKQLQSRKDLPGEIDVEADKSFLSEIESRVKSLSLTTPTLKALQEEANAPKHSGDAQLSL